jgi:hypothetical protein
MIGIPRYVAELPHGCGVVQAVEFYKNAAELCI